MSGMVVEEPDIEIGAGVSSKAIGQRIVAGFDGKRGRNSHRFGGGGRSARLAPITTATSLPTW
ncbi:uncharacterized protein N7496_010679 [Penicillium cataractarum]|uniref:Uncharacterized protein n=1 Tax=Penicillium cataractarum TaxID=2100454 RepID=A0A9W9RRC2_9EURO|nr:uncharacterized protein N7496_010679 [Penicillium cataractarum]KAJ5364966.1 hypothetical protein N7496_010679 [Penicillium cataractarum]